MSRSSSPAKKLAKAKPRGPGRLSAEATEQLEERLVDAAESVFLSQGFARATVDAVAKAAGATRKTVYARYANKEEIFSAVVSRLIDREIALPSLEAPMQHANPRDQLMKLAHLLIAFVDTPQIARLNRLVFAEGHQTPELPRLSGQLYEREIANVMAVLTPLRDSGALPKLPEPHAAAVMFIELVSSTARMRAMLGAGAALPRKQIEAYVAGAVDLFLTGCGYRA